MKYEPHDIGGFSDRVSLTSLREKAIENFIVDWPLISSWVANTECNRTKYLDLILFFRFFLVQRSLFHVFCRSLAMFWKQTAEFLRQNPTLVSFCMSHANVWPSMTADSFFYPSKYGSSWSSRSLCQRASRFLWCFPVRPFRVSITDCEVFLYKL